MKVRLFILIQFICTITGEFVFAQSKPYQLFEQYLSTFEKQELPLQVNSEAVNNLFNDLGIYNKATSYCEIKGDSKNFIPEEIIEDTIKNNFYSQYLLPDYNDIILVVIIKLCYDEYDNEIVRQYLVSYKKNGTVIDYLEVSCVILDFMEAVFKISEDYIIEQSVYKDVETENEELYQLGTFLKYSVNENGVIEILSKNEQKGYLQMNGDFIITEP